MSIGGYKFCDSQNHGNRGFRPNFYPNTTNADHELREQKTGTLFKRRTHCVPNALAMRRIHHD